MKFFHVFLLCLMLFTSTLSFAEVKETEGQSSHGRIFFPVKVSEEKERVVGISYDTEDLHAIVFFKGNTVYVRVFPTRLRLLLKGKSEKTVATKTVSVPKVAKQVAEYGKTEKPSSVFVVDFGTPLTEDLTLTPPKTAKDKQAGIRFLEPKGDQDRMGILFIYENKTLVYRCEGTLISLNTLNKQQSDTARKHVEKVFRAAGRKSAANTIGGIK